MPGNPLTDPNWAPNLANTVERYVSLVRDKATTKVVLVVRALVFGIVISFAGIAAITLLIILATKFIQRLVAISFRVDHGSSVWISYALVGAVFTLGGFVLLRMRSPKAVPA